MKVRKMINATIWISLIVGLTGCVTLKPSAGIDKDGKEATIGLQVGFGAKSGQAWKDFIGRIGNKLRADTDTDYEE